MRMKLRNWCWCCFAIAAPTAQALKAGDVIVQGGWFYLSPQESSTPLNTKLAPSLLGSVLGIEQEFSSPCTFLSVNDSSTPALTVSYFLTDHLVIKLEGGVPAEFELSGQGLVRPTGVAGELLSVDLAGVQNNPLATVRQWSPAILAQYYFGDVSARLRPYIGVGVTYTWFDNIELNKNFEQSLKQNFGSVLALATGSGSETFIDGEADSDIAPIFNVGLALDLDDRWSLSVSVSYLALETTSNIAITAKDGALLSESRSKLELNPIISSVLISYRWGDG